MHVKQALSEIAALRLQMARNTDRLQMARNTEFHGYGPATLAMTGVLAAVAALAQSRWIDPSANIRAYLCLWSGVAVVAVAMVAAEAIRRSRRAHEGLADDMLAAAAGEILPAAFAGVLVTFVLLVFAPEALWMLPGLWQIILSLGTFAACRSLPPLLRFVAVWYLATGLACLALARGEHALSPWAMGLPFTIGEGLTAALLWVSYRSEHV
jgi:hypothetical protein